MKFNYLPAVHFKFLVYAALHDLDTGKTFRFRQVILEIRALLSGMYCSVMCTNTDGSKELNIDFTDRCDGVEHHMW